MNWLNDKFLNKPAVYGTWLCTGSGAVAQLAGQAGLDWALLDMEHGLADQNAIMRQIEAMAKTPCSPIVRVPRWDSDFVPRALDYGAAGIMAPMVNTPEQAQALAKAMHYPPTGARGVATTTPATAFGRDFKEYFSKANTHVTLMVQLETPQSVENADAMAAIDGVDVLFIGHSDLTLNMGCFKKMFSPAVRQAEEVVLEACRRHGKRAGLVMRSGMDTQEYCRRGFSVIAIGSDLGCLQTGFSNLMPKQA